MSENRVARLDLPPKHSPSEWYAFGGKVTWFTLLGWPVYEPWKLFEWWYFYEAYASEVFDRAGMLAGASGFMGCAAAVVGSLWRVHHAKHAISILRGCAYVSVFVACVKAVTYGIKVSRP